MQVAAKYLFEQVRKQLTGDNIGKAIKTLQVIADSSSAPEAMQGELAYLASRFEELEMYMAADTIDRGFAAVQRSKMLQQLNKIVDQLEVSLQSEKFDVELRITGPVEKNVSDWFQTLFAA